MKILWGFLGIIILLVVLSLFFGMNKIAGKSMEPAMKDQTTVLTRRFFLVSPELQRGDIIIYKKNNLGSVYVG